MQAADEKPTNGQHAGDEENGSHPARDLSLHLLRMLETRMDAAGIVLQSESRRIISRLQLHLLAAAAVFIAIWGAIVLIAIALPENLRVPVLSAVVAAFVIGAVVAWQIARKRAAGREVGSLAWFLEGLKLDLEVLARSLSQAQNQSKPQAPQPDENPPPEQPRSPPSDIAA